MDVAGITPDPSLRSLSGAWMWSNFFYAATTACLHIWTAVDCSVLRFAFTARCGQPGQSRNLHLPQPNVDETRNCVIRRIPVTSGNQRPLPSGRLRWRAKDSWTVITGGNAPFTWDRVIAGSDIVETA